MTRTLASVLGAAILLAATPAMAAQPARTSAQEEVRIPFVNHGGIRNWRAYDRDVLYIEDAHRRWYKAELMGPCLDLNFVEQIGFETRGGDTFDRFAAVRVGRDRCQVRSLVALPGEPTKKSAKAERN